ncbi:type II toxin-antitoxin system RelE family toxin [Chromobacterium vaccinii]|uniref:type II toxin-antitoxin system RelE family toxin n=1 Tax=Chromobacterium vaccinii TaxID=1108595 RepID=UPI003C718C66
MSYELEFLEDALKEWSRLDASVRRVFKRKLEERLQNPKVPSAKLRTMKDCYKIKLHDVGYRLIYQVSDNKVVVTVIAVGRRDKGAVYQAAQDRLDD